MIGTQPLSSLGDASTERRRLSAHLGRAVVMQAPEGHDEQLVDVRPFPFPLRLLIFVAASLGAWAGVIWLVVQAARLM